MGLSSDPTCCTAQKIAFEREEMLSSDCWCQRVHFSSSIEQIVVGARGFTLVHQLNGLLLVPEGLLWFIN